MSKAPGHPLSEYEWLVPTLQPPTSSQQHLRQISQDGKQKIMSQIGAIMFRLSQLRIEKLGSLFQDDNDDYVVGECLSPSFVWQDRDSLKAVDRGPFDNERAYLKSLISVYVSHVHELPLTPHAFFAPIPDVSEYASWARYKAATTRWNDFVSVGQKIDHSKNRFAYCMAGQLMDDMIPSMCDTASDTTGEGFPLGHTDLHPGNIYVDENLNVTCIIDWGSASSVPLAELLTTPGMPNSTFLPEASLTAAFRGGFERASGHGQLSGGMWERVDMQWHLQRLLRMLSIRDYHHFEALYALVHRPDGGEHASADVPGLFSERGRRSENRRLLDELSEEDWSDEYVRKQERTAFGNPPPAQRLAVARKLTLVSEMNKGFVADRRLWQWIEKALEDFDVV